MVTLGEVNYRGELTLPINVRDRAGNTHEIPAVIDTGFTGYLTLPKELIDALVLESTDSDSVTLGDGSETALRQFFVEIAWMGRSDRVRAYEVDGIPLIGVRLLRECYVAFHGIDGGAVTVYRP